MLLLDNSRIYSSRHYANSHETEIRDGKMSHLSGSVIINGDGGSR